MKVAGEAVLNAPVAAVWEALLDPQVLVRTIPGCEVLEETGDNAYAMTVSAGVASIRGSYTGTCALSDLVPHESLVMRAQGAGAPGTVAADVVVRFADRGDGTTGISYAADAVVGGMIGGVGQRMLTAVSKRMAGEFFGAVDDALSGAGAEPDGTAKPEATSSARTDDTSLPGQRFTAPAASTTRGRGRAGSNDDFVRGVVVGGVLVLAGVVAGGLFGRRSR